LSDLYVRQARDYLSHRGGQVLVKSPVAHLEMAGKEVSAVVLRDGARLVSGAYVSAVPPGAFLKMVPPDLRERHALFEKIEQLKFAPIISIHLWFDRALSKSMFAGLLDTQVQWFFNKSRIYRNAKSRGYCSLVISGAHRLIGWDDQRLLTLAMEELRRLFPEARSAVLLRSLVIKEHQATLSPGVGAEALRPGHVSPWRNFFIAGDWTRTGLPATIESACVSGHACAELAAQSLSRREAAPPPREPSLRS